MICSTINGAMTIQGGSQGALLAGRYRIVRQLGHGGMGSVWLVEDMHLDNKQFAIKMLPSILVSNKRAYRQLKKEALVSLNLTHTNIVNLRAFEENNGNPFLVMDYIEGRTLDDYLAEKGALTEEETVSILKPIADALDYAHSKNNSGDRLCSFGPFDKRRQKSTFQNLAPRNARKACAIRLESTFPLQFPKN